jgi:hypothetical protein
VHVFESAVQLVPAACFESAGQFAETPLQVSAASHSPAAERQTVPEFPAGQLQTCELHCTAVVHGLASSMQATVIESVTEVGESDVSKQTLSALALLTQIVKLYGPHVEVEVGASYSNWKLTVPPELTSGFSCMTSVLVSLPFVSLQLAGDVPPVPVHW